MLKLFRFLKPKEWGMIAGTIAFIVLQVWLDLKLPDYMSTITKLVQTPGSNIKDIWANGGWMLLCAFGSAACSFVVGFFAARVSASFSFMLRKRLFDKIESFSVAEMKKFSTASLITRSTNDVTQVQLTIAMGLQVLVRAPVMAIWAVTKIVGKSWQWSLATAAAVVILLLSIGTMMLIAVPRFKKIQTLTDNLNRVTRENLLGARVVRAFGAEEFSENKFDKANTDITQNGLVIFRTLAFMAPMMTMVMGGLSLSIYWIGAGLINGANMLDKLTIFSEMVVFSSYAVQVVMSFMMLTMIFVLLPRAQVSANRINEVLDTKNSIEDGLFDGETEEKGVVEFRNVSFKYPDAEEWILHNVSFCANQGETVAFIGSTGSGKSTLVNLVPRFYDATEGSILVDGVDTKKYRKEALNKKIGYISQKAVLFSGSVRDNVVYGDTVADDETALQAIEYAQSKSFVDEMGGLDGQIAQGGKNVSGGQKQRLSIARALAKNPEILIFDDSFSALDFATDKKLRNALSKLESKPTNLIVAQRVGTIKNADKIVVLDKGEVVGIGTHKDLLKNCSVYKEIAESQLSKEEL